MLILYSNMLNSTSLPQSIGWVPCSKLAWHLHVFKYMLSFVGPRLWQAVPSGHLVPMFTSLHGNTKQKKSRLVKKCLVLLMLITLLLWPPHINFYPGSSMSSPRNVAVALGAVHSDLIVRLVGLALQSNRCWVVWGCILQSGHRSVSEALMEWR